MFDPAPLTKELESNETILEKHSVLTEHHIYELIWTPIIEEILHLEAEDGNQHDKYTVAVMKKKTIKSLDTCLIVFPEFHDTS